MAKKTVYFEVKEKKDSFANLSPNAQASGEGTAAPGGTDGSPVSAFDGNTATNTSSVSVGEIVVVPTVPTELPVQFTVSPATISSLTPGT
jgi:hypothetical protein